VRFLRQLPSETGRRIAPPRRHPAVCAGALLGIAKTLLPVIVYVPTSLAGVYVAFALYGWQGEPGARSSSQR
jgi:hypothetical protein